MADYRDNYNERISVGADIAETNCVKFLNSQEGLYWYKLGFDEINRKIPTQYFFKIPGILRNIPDYVCIKKKAFFLECKGYKGYLKIKEEDLKGYSSWNRIMDLYVFAFNCANMKYDIISFDKLSSMISESEIDKYPDNNKIYYKVKVEK